MPKTAKNLINGIIDELAKDERIAELYRVLVVKIVDQKKQDITGETFIRCILTTTKLPEENH